MAKEKLKQSNYYYVTDIHGRYNDQFTTFASNIKEAIAYFNEKAKKDPKLRKALYFGKVKRSYNGGVRG